MLKYVFGVIVSKNKKRITSEICDNIYEYQIHAEQEQTKECVLYDFIFMKF